MRMIITNDYKRISKAQARKLFDSGQDVRVCPVNVIPDNNMWSQDWNKANFHEAEQPDKDLFTSIVNAWQYYNGNSKQLGYYPAFYVKVSE